MFSLVGQPEREIECKGSEKKRYVQKKENLFAYVLEILYLCAQIEKQKHNTIYSI